jgi:hypothetical protein
VTYPYADDLAVDSLRKNAANPNEMDDRTFNALCESIQEEGWTEPVTVVPSGDEYVIVGGHHRFDAAVTLGMERVPCWVLDPAKFDEDRQGWNLVKMNVLRGQLNPSKFTALYERMVKTYGAEVLQSLMGFTSEDAFKKMYQDVRKSLPPELAKALDSTKDEIKTIDDLSLVLNRLFREHGETLPTNLMVFSWGGKDVLWVRCSDDLWKVVTGMAKRTVEDEGDMSQVLLEALTRE